MLPTARAVVRRRPPKSIISTISIQDQLNPTPRGPKPAVPTSGSSDDKKPRRPRLPAVVRAPGALRPHLGVRVHPDHGLYAFFRKTVEPTGAVKYDTVEASEISSAEVSGRPWLAAELRRKSFRDLHTLWYIVLRERNLLATQMEEARRGGAPDTHNQLYPERMFKCRKTMARIKCVLNERRLAYEGAVKIFAEKQEVILQRRERTSARQKRREKLKQRRAERKALKVAGEDTKEIAPEEVQRLETVVEQPTTSLEEQEVTSESKDEPSWTPYEGALSTEKPRRASNNPFSKVRRPPLAQREMPEPGERAAAGLFEFEQAKR